MLDSDLHLSDSKFLTLDTSAANTPLSIYPGLALPVFKKILVVAKGIFFDLLLLTFVG